MKNKIKKASTFAFWASLLGVFALFGCAKPVNPVLNDGNIAQFVDRKNLPPIYFVGNATGSYSFTITNDNISTSGQNRFIVSRDGSINGPYSNTLASSFHSTYPEAVSLETAVFGYNNNPARFIWAWYNGSSISSVGVDPAFLASIPSDLTYDWSGTTGYSKGLMAISSLTYPHTFTITFDTAPDTQSIYSEGYNDGYDVGYSSGNADGYSEGYDDGVSDGYSSGYSQGLSDGYSSGYDQGSTEGYSEGYSQGYSSAQNLYKDNFILGRSLDGVIYPQYETYTPEEAFNLLYVGSPLGYNYKAVTFNDGSYLQYFKEAFPLGNNQMAMGYRYISSGGVSYPLYYVVSANASPYSGKEIHLSNYSNDIGFFRFRSVLDIGSLVITELDEGVDTLNVSVLSPSYDDGYAQGYKDGQEAPTNLPNDYAAGYAQGFADGNDGWNSIIPSIFASCGAFFYPWTTIQIFGISILGLFGILTVIGVVALCLKVFLK